ncbi:Protein sel-1 like 3 [Dissostichus eleginoides]|uniref:Protein sel-1 like 3 n=1 Tax=Dissostichus eleginoides TaxID=100907 RepID=A0AAD9F989_DISEL|nr:Protein sel-1 like 3 [Dissostichus eleginoides]
MSLRNKKKLQCANAVISASSPPTETPTETPAWSARILQISRNHQCSHESAVEDLLKFPLASTGETFGLARRFQPFRQRGLERARLHAVTQPR